MKKVYFHKTITFWLFFTPLALSCNNFSLKTENVVKNKLNKKYNEKAIALKKSTGCASHSFFERKLKKNGLLFCNKMQLSMKNENMNTSKRILNFLNTLSKEELRYLKSVYQRTFFKYLNNALRSLETEKRYISILIFKKMLHSLSKKEYNTVIAHFFLEIEENNNVFEHTQNKNELWLKISIIETVQSLIVESSIPRSWKIDFEHAFFEKIQSSESAKYRFGVIYNFFLR